MEEEIFMPEVVEALELPDEWSPEKSIVRIQGWTSLVKPKIANIVREFWIAHEMIVNRKIKDWTWERFCDESGYSRRTPLNWFEKYELPITRITHKVVQNFSTHKIQEEKTRMETKILTYEVVNSIDYISDDDLKTIGDAIAGKISSGKAEARVGTEVARAVKNTFKKGVTPEPKEPDNFARLWKHTLSFAEGLQFFADGTIKPETETEVVAAQGIMDAGPHIVVHYSRLGLNIKKVYDTFIDPERRNRNQHTTEKLPALGL